MGIHQGQARRGHDLHPPPEGKLADAPGDCLGHPLEYLKQVLSRDPLHGEVEPLLMIPADLVDRNRIGMLQLCRHPGLSQQPTILLPIHLKLPEQRFHHDSPTSDLVEAGLQNGGAAPGHLPKIRVLVDALRQGLRQFEVGGRKQDGTVAFSLLRHGNFRGDEGMLGPPRIVLDSFLQDRCASGQLPPGMPAFC